MAYITAKELRAVVPDEYRDAALSDQDGTQPDPGMLQNVIDAACNEVDALIEGRVNLPLSQPYPQKIKTAAVYIALSLLFTRRGIAMPEDTAKTVSWWRERLGKVGAGDLRIEAPDEETDSASTLSTRGSIVVRPSITGTGGLIGAILMLLSVFGTTARAIDARTFEFTAPTNPMIESPDFMEWSQAESVGLRYVIPAADGTRDVRWEISDSTNLWLNMAPVRSGTVWSWNPAPTQTCLVAGRYQGRVAVYARTGTNLTFHRIIARQDIRVHPARDPLELVISSPLSSILSERDPIATNLIVVVSNALHGAITNEAELREAADDAIDAVLATLTPTSAVQALLAPYALQSWVSNYLAGVESNLPAGTGGVASIEWGVGSNQVPRGAWYLYTSNQAAAAWAAATNADAAAASAQATANAALPAAWTNGAAWTQTQAKAASALQAEADTLANAALRGDFAGTETITPLSVNSRRFGNEAGRESSNTFNLFMGDFSGRFMDGDYCVAAGMSALNESTGKIHGATAVGPYAGWNATSGNFVTNHSSTYVGSHAGDKSRGSDFTAVGAYALAFADGSQSSAFGYHAAQFSSSTGSSSLGFVAGERSEGSYWSALGSAAGTSSTGGYWSAIGGGAGVLSRGNSWLSIGRGSGYASIGDEWTAIGRYAGMFATWTNSTAIGTLAGRGATGSNRIYIDSIPLSAIPDIADPLYAATNSAVFIDDGAVSLGRGGSYTNLPAKANVFRGTWKITTNQLPDIPWGSLVGSGSGWTNLAESGSGNVVTGAVASGGTLTLYRGTIENGSGLAYNFVAGSNVTIGVVGSNVTINADPQAGGGGSATNLPWSSATTNANAPTQTINFASSAVEYVAPTSSTVMAWSLPAGSGAGRKTLIFPPVPTNISVSWPTNLWIGAGYFNLSSTTNTILAAWTVQTPQNTNRAVELLRIPQAQ